MSWFSEQLAYAAEWLDEFATEEITYYRSGQTAITLNAMLAKSLLRVSGNQGSTRVERVNADFVIASADLDFGLGPVEPLAGDIIGVTFGDVVKWFRVSAIGSEPAWHYCEGYQYQLRVHTKQLGQSDRSSITLSPSTIANKPIGVAVSQQITAAGGVDPCTYAISAGALPTGLTLSSAGLLAGTPTVLGASTFTVRATDLLGMTGSRSYTLTIV